MMLAGTFVTHPMFPDWGKGVITAIFFDTQSQKHIAKVMWQGVRSPAHAALHTLEHLKKFEEF